MSIESSNLWRDFWSESLPAILVFPEGHATVDMPRGSIILPGSFNPLHDGHRKLAEAASQMLGLEVVFELSVSNVDKSAIGEAEVLRRIEQFAGYAPVALTRAAVFSIKAKLFAGSVFAVGYDTAERIVSLRCYANEEELRAALREIGKCGSSFLVACRALKDQLHCLEDLALPPEFKPLFSGIPKERFRFDISSTWLREQQR